MSIRVPFVLAPTICGRVQGAQGISKFQRIVPLALWQGLSRNLVAGESIIEGGADGF
jgi:hypothetical protein